MKMRLFISTSRHKQRGTALVFSLLILLIMTIIGVAALSNTQMQERMAGNMNVQSLAFEAASAGISEALAHGMARWDDRGCNREDGGWTSADSPNGPRPLPLPTDIQQLDIEYSLQADCLESPGFSESSDPEFQPPVQMYVTSQAAVLPKGGAVTDSLATREIEVRIDDFRSDGLSAIRVEGDAEVTFGPADARKFIVDGSGGPAISTSSLENSNSIVRAIDDAERLGNYKGGVGRSDYDSPFNSASQLARFALEIRAFLEAHADRQANPGGSVAPDSECDLSSLDLDPDTFAEFLDSFDPENFVPSAHLRFVDGDFDVKGGTNFEGLTYVTGDLDMGPVEGSGMMIVEGNVEWHGNAQFQGVVIGLGGDFVFKGLGNGETKGMVFVADVALSNLTGKYLSDIRDKWNDLPLSGGWEGVLEQLDRSFGDSSTVTDFADGDLIDTEHPASSEGFGDTLVNFAGGGNHTMTYSCEMFDGWRQILSNCGDMVHERADGLDNVGLAEPWGDAGCGIPGRGGTIQAIRSWRENLGWRELLDSSS